MHLAVELVDHRAVALRETAVARHLELSESAAGVALPQLDFTTGTSASDRVPRRERNDLPGVACVRTERAGAVAGLESRCLPPAAADRRERAERALRIVVPRDGERQLDVDHVVVHRQRRFWAIGCLDVLRLRRLLLRVCRRLGRLGVLQVSGAGAAVADRAAAGRVGAAAHVGGALGQL